MGFIEEIAKAKTALTQKDVDLAILDPGARQRLSTANLPVYPVWFFAPERGIPRRIDIRELRQFSRSAWVQMVKNAIKKAVLQTDWDIVVKEDVEEDEERYKEEILFVKHFFEHPNREPQQDFDHLISQILDDILDVDAGVIYFNGPVDGNLKEMIAYDGSSFFKELSVSGFTKNWWQYSFRHPMNSPIKFEPEEILDFQMNKRTHDPYGFSPLQSVQQVVQVLDQATRYNKDFFENNAIPSLLISIMGQKDAARKFKMDWLEQLQGENAKVIVTNSSDAKVQQMALSNRDMEWLDGQKWYMHLIFAAYGLSPTEVGFTDSTGSKNVQEGQMKITIKNAHMPYLRLISRALSRFAIPRILGEAKKPIGERTPIEFKYFPKDADMEAMETEAQRKDVASNILTVNEVRAQRGLEPFEAPQADDPYAVVEFEEGGEEGEDNQEVPREKAPQETELQGRRGGGGSEPDVVKDSVLHNPPNHPETSGSEPPLAKTVEPISVEANKPYAKWFELVIDEWETQITKAISSKLYKVPRTWEGEDVFLKEFSDFLSALLRGVAITPFLNLLTRVVKTTMTMGVDEAEKELDLNITTGLDFNRTVDREVQQQFNGYTLPSGKKWVGLRGVARALQQKVYDRVRTGFENREQTDTMIDDVQKLLDGVKRSRAATIVRTESTRLVNEGKVQGYKAANVGGKKEYVAFLDARTTDICKHLHGQKRGFDEPFDGPNGEQFITPPAHANCRSFVRFVRE